MERCPGQGRVWRASDGKHMWRRRRREQQYVTAPLNVLSDRKCSLTNCGIRPFVFPPIHAGVGSSDLALKRKHVLTDSRIRYRWSEPALGYYDNWTNSTHRSHDETAAAGGSFFP